MRVDLTVLRTRFDALVTYDAIHGAQRIAALTAALHFRALIVGAWNPLDATRRPGRPPFIRSCARAFAYFAAFDAPWRAQDVTGVPGPHPEEAYWGLYDSARRAKPAVDQLPPLAQDPTSRNSH